MFGLDASLSTRTSRSAKTLPRKVRASAGIFSIACHSSALGLFGRWSGCRGVRGEHMTALIVGLVSIAVVWLVVIYGSIYVNKNVQ
jgi:hypothetical protein